jgi:hypothetical protein
MTNSTVARRVARAFAGLGALVAVVVVTTAAGMQGNPGPASDVVRSSASVPWPWIIFGACAGIGAIAVVFVRRRRREQML